MENLGLKTTIEQWITARKQLEKEKQLETIIEKILTKVEGILREGIKNGTVVEEMIVDIIHEGRVILLWNYANDDNSGFKKEGWDVLYAKSQKGREEIYKALEKYFKRYAGLYVEGKVNNMYHELKVSVKVKE